MNENLPKGWSQSTLGGLLHFKYGKSLPKEKRDGFGSVEVFGSNGVVGLHSESITQAPAIIIGRKGSVGEVHLSQKKCWPIDTTYFVDEFPVGLPAAYWTQCLKALGLGHQEKSSAIPGISRDDIYAVEVALPPLLEQERIAAKLSVLLGKAEDSKQRLGRISQFIKRFRQSVLAAACSGRLTADWRESRNEEQSWVPCKLAKVGVVSGGITKNSKRKSQPITVSFLRVANVYENRLVLDEVHSIGVTQTEFQRTRLEKGDILFVEGNGSIDQVGRVALWDASISPCIHQNHLIKFRSNNRVIPEYVLLQMMAPSGREQLMEKSISSAGLNTLSISKISEVELEIAPIAEQEEIVRRAYKLFALADKIEKRFKVVQLQIDRLPRSILAKAFRGELVPTEAELAEREGRTYESAEQLLQRIRAAMEEDESSNVSKTALKRRAV